MNRPLDPAFDQRLADWFEDDLSTAPREVLGTVLAAFPSIEQRRASRVPWRLPTMRSIGRLAGVAIAVVLALGVVVVASRPGGIGGFLSGPTPTPSAPIAAGGYTADLPVAAVLARVNGSALDAASKQAVIASILGIEGATTLHLRIILSGDQFTLWQGADDDALQANTPWHITRNDGSTIAFDRIPSGTATAEYQVLRSGDGASFKLVALTPAESQLETLVRDILFNTTPYVPTRAQP